MNLEITSFYTPSIPFLSFSHTWATWSFIFFFPWASSIIDLFTWSIIIPPKSFYPIVCQRFHPALPSDSRTHISGSVSRPPSLPLQLVFSTAETIFAPPICTMASANAGYTTGAGRDEADLRRRNVASYENTNGQHIYKFEAEDKKKITKVRLYGMSLPRGMLTAPAQHWHPRYAGRVGIYHCPSHLHTACVIYEALEDRTVSDCDLGRSSVGSIGHVPVGPMLTSHQFREIRLPLPQARVLL